MKLPNGDEAYIDRRKLVDYALNPDHDDGKHKAALFRDLLGMTRESVEELISVLRQGALEGEAVPGRRDRYGHRYTVDIDLTGPRGAVVVRSAWIIRAQEDFPRLVTCYIL
ncbi:MAG: hypothetical protein FLDDKLPJ_01094 [Phycisphaerae bacterium]|nr:hypothetical protein [Phycisphaerae bacterium]